MLDLPIGSIPALTLYGCWAWSIAHSEPADAANDDPAKPWIKDCENRSRPLPDKLVGVPIAIHAGAHAFGPGTWAERTRHRHWWTWSCEQTGSTIPETVPLREIAAFAVFGSSEAVLRSPWRIVDTEEPTLAWPVWQVWRLPVALPVTRGALGVWRLQGVAADELRKLAVNARRVL